jgi:hypothetical protein
MYREKWKVRCRRITANYNLPEGMAQNQARE